MKQVLLGILLSIFQFSLFAQDCSELSSELIVDGSKMRISTIKTPLLFGKSLGEGIELTTIWFKADFIKKQEPITYAAILFDADEKPMTFTSLEFVEEYKNGIYSYSCMVLIHEQQVLDLCLKLIDYIIIGDSEEQISGSDKKLLQRLAACTYYNVYPKD